SSTGFANVDAGVFLGSLVGVVLLFSVPVTLLGCVSPFAIRLAMHRVGGAGNTAGGIYALSTIGSIVGTLLPVFVLIPIIGTHRTFHLLSLLLIGVSAYALRKYRAWYFWLLLPIACLAVIPPGIIRPASFGQLIYST